MQTMGPINKNILRQSYDNAKVTIDFRPDVFFEERKAFLGYDSLAKS